MRTLLAGLARMGVACRALMCSVLDAPQRLDAESFLSAWGLARVGAVNGRSLWGGLENGVEHVVLATADSRRGELRAHEENAFHQLAMQQMDSFRPDAVLGFGGLVLERAIFREARRRSIPTLFYLANANYPFAEAFEDVDRILTPSVHLGEYYRRHSGLDSVALGPFIDLDRVRGAPETQAWARDWALFVNPAPEKGLGLVLALARRAGAALPEARFMLLEGRWRAADLAARYGIDWSAWPNVLWLENQADMRPLYAQARVLLYPSLCFEGFGRAVLEAMANGVPVLASRAGALPEAVGAGGECLELPASRTEEGMSGWTDAHVQPWLKRLTRLWREPGHFLAQSQRARKQAAQYDLAARVGAVKAEIESIRATRSAS